MPCHAGVLLLCIIIIPKDGWLVMTFAIAGKFTITMALGIIFFYSSELFPTVIRTTGMGTSTMICRDYYRGQVIYWVKGSVLVLF